MNHLDTLQFIGTIHRMFRARASRFLQTPPTHPANLPKEPCVCVTQINHHTQHTRADDPPPARAEKNKTEIYDTVPVPGNIKIGYWRSDRSAVQRFMFSQAVQQRGKAKPTQGRDRPSQHTRILARNMSTGHGVPSRRNVAHY